MLTSASGRTGTARVSDVYPALAQVPQDLFGLCVVGVNGANLRERRLGHSLLDHERVEAVRVRVGLAGSGRGRCAPATGRQRDRAAVQLAGGGRARRGRPNESNGQFGRHRHDQPRARLLARGKMAVHSRWSVAICRPRARHERCGVRIGKPKQFAQSGDRPIASQLRADRHRAGRRGRRSIQGNVR